MDWKWGRYEVLSHRKQTKNEELGARTWGVKSYYFKNSEGSYHLLFSCVGPLLLMLKEHL